MTRYTTIIKQFEQQGEKTGWSYIDVPAKIGELLNPGVKKSYRVKGRLDKYPIEAVALLPMGGGDFIIPMNADIRKGTGKRKGDKITVELEVDHHPEPVRSPEFMACLQDDPEAFTFFNSLAKSHREYFMKWIESAKTEQTKSKRIAQSLTGLSRKMDYGAMIRYFRDHKDDLPSL